MALPTDDTLEVLQLYARYNTAIDTGDGDAFAACFVEKGVFDSGVGVNEGRAAIAEFARTTHQNLPGMRHLAHNIVIDGDGEEARGSAFLVGYLVTDGFKVIVTGRYRDRLSRGEGRWLFSERIFKADA